ncbi:MAG: glucose-1-phosphate adenylyltransferase subunit GlgD [Oscillospiraceae bacterium]
MTDLHGIVYAYHSSPALGDLVLHRTAASLPFCSRYRLIDFALSAMANAGIRDVGVIMRQDYQSLLDHLGSGKDWDLSRGSGGLSLLPPFGTSDSRSAQYSGCIDALSAMRTYIGDIRQENIVLFRGDLAVNIDLRRVFEQHKASGAEITAVCTEKPFDSSNNVIRFLPDTSTSSRRMLYSGTSGEGLPSMEVYIISKKLLISFIDDCRARGKVHFHRDALAHYFKRGGFINLYLHQGYTAHLCSVPDFYSANMDMLNGSLRSQLFPENHPVFTRGRSSVSTYYGDNSSAKNSLVADGCFIEGELTNCVLFRGVRVNRGAKLHDCIIMPDTIIGRDARLSCVISDKDATISDGLVLTGTKSLPIVVPKGKQL